MEPLGLFPFPPRAPNLYKSEVLEVAKIDTNEVKKSAESIFQKKFQPRLQILVKLTVVLPASRAEILHWRLFRGIPWPYVT